MATNHLKTNPVPEGFVPNKALGQNFLSSVSIIDAILEHAQAEGKRVLEIGPGTGALTEGLLSRAAYLAAIEKDGRLCELLQERFGERLTLLHADMLDADIPALMGTGPWHRVGNPPCLRACRGDHRLLLQRRDRRQCAARLLHAAAGGGQRRGAFGTKQASRTRRKRVSFVFETGVFDAQKDAV